LKKRPSLKVPPMVDEVGAVSVVRAMEEVSLPSAGMTEVAREVAPRGSLEAENLREGWK
jgi:hypothetical protein